MSSFQFDSFDKLNIISIHNPRIIIKIDNNTLEPVSDYPTNIDEYIERIDENPDLEKEIMSGKYNIFNY